MTAKTIRYRIRFYKVKKKRKRTRLKNSLKAGHAPSVQVKGGLAV